MMDPTYWNGELVADLASQGSGLGEAQMMGVGRRSTADQARLPSTRIGDGPCRAAGWSWRQSGRGQGGSRLQAPSLGQVGRLSSLGWLSVHQLWVGLGSIACWVPHRRRPRAWSGNSFQPASRRGPSGCFWSAGSDAPRRRHRRWFQGPPVRRASDPVGARIGREQGSGPRLG